MSTDFSKSIFLLHVHVAIRWYQKNSGKYCCCTSDRDDRCQWAALDVRPSACRGVTVARTLGAEHAGELHWAVKVAAIGGPAHLWNPGQIEVGRWCAQWRLGHVSLDQLKVMSAIERCRTRCYLVSRLSLAGTRPGAASGSTRRALWRVTYDLTPLSRRSLRVGSEGAPCPRPGPGGGG